MKYEWRDFPFIENIGGYRVIPIWLCFALMLGVATVAALARLVFG